MRVLVTGAAGFIGRHLVRHLADHGHDVAGIDMHDGDLTLSQPKVADRLVSARESDLVVHLAAQVGRVFGEDDPVHTLRSNTLMTMLVARAAASVNASVLYASTSEVYGDQGDRVCHEDDPKLLPHNLYGLSKRWGEEVCQLYAPRDLKIARFSMPYGPGAPPGRGRRALDNFLWQAIHRKPIPVHKGAERSWCWIGDVCEGVRLIIERGESGAYNVGRDDDPVSMRQLAERACEMTGAPLSLIQDVDAPGAQTVVKRLSTAKLRALGWRPIVELDDGMRKLLEWVERFDAAGHRVAA